jgi:hypothetical protein
VTAQLDRTLLERIYQTGDLPLLGYVAFWRIAEAGVSTTDLAAALTAHGFGDFAPKVPTYRAALRVAIEEWLDAQGLRRAHSTGAKRARRERLTVVNDEASTTMAFVVQAEELDLARLGLDASTRLRFILWKEGPQAGQFTATTAASGNSNEALTEEGAVVREVGALYARHRGLHDSADLARLVKQIVETFRVVSLRANGGVYFIPAAFRPQVEQLRGLFATLAAVAGHGADLFLALTPVMDLAEMRQQYGALALTAMQAEAQSMGRYLRDNFLAKPSGTVAAATIGRQLAEYRAFRAKAESYADLLNMRAEDILAEVGRLEKLATAVVVKGLAGGEGEDDPFAPPAENPDYEAAK